MYTIATTNFMVYGGDDFHEVVNLYNPRNIKNFTILRDIVYNYAMEKKVLNTLEDPCIKESEPRLILVPSCDYLINEAEIKRIAIIE